MTEIDITKKGKFFEFPVYSIGMTLHINALVSNYAGMYDEMGTLCLSRSQAEDLYRIHESKFEDQLDEYTSREFVISQLHAIVYYLTHVEHVDLISGYYITDMVKIED